MHSIQATSSPRFRRRQSLISPECSTVVEINPTCESQESMLEKIIFPHQRDQFRVESNKNSDRYSSLSSKRYDQSMPLTEHKSSHFGIKRPSANFEPSIEALKKKYGKLQQRDKSLSQLQTLPNRPLSSVEPKQQITSRKKALEQYDVNSKQILRQIQQSKSQKVLTENLLELRQNSHANRTQRMCTDHQGKVRTCKLNSYNSETLDAHPKRLKKHQQQIALRSAQQSINSNQLTIDEEKLRKIQNKIQKYCHNSSKQPQKLRRNIEKIIDKENVHSQKSAVQEFRKFLGEKHLFQNSNSHLKNGQKTSSQQFSELAEISFKNSQIQNIYKKKYEAPFKEDHDNNLRQRKDFLERSLTQVFETVKGKESNDFLLSSGNCKISSLPDSVKFLLGPIFGEVIIRNTQLNINQFLSKALLLVEGYSLEELKKVFGFYKHKEPTFEIYNSKIQQAQQRSKLLRQPGKLMSNSRAQNNVFKNVSLHYEDSRSNKQNVFEKTKKLKFRVQEILQKKEKQDQLQTFRQKKQSNRVTEAQNTPLNVQSPLKLEFFEKDYHREVNNGLNNDLRGRQTQKNDQDLQRLERLQSRFKQHFQNKIHDLD